jgi:DNA-binding transcriptional MerR regulator
MKAMSGYSTAQVAGILGVSKVTILNWLRQGLLEEPRRSSVAGMEWRMWSEADLKRAREVKAKMRRGPKPKKP